MLLKNEKQQLPLNAATVKTIAVIGGHADVGMLSGGGSAQVDPSRRQRNYASGSPRNNMGKAGLVSHVADESDHGKGAKCRCYI